MKVTVIGASGRIGRPLVVALRSAGHEVVAASRRTGVDATTGAGLADALRGADVLIDVSNPPDPGAAHDFFTRATGALVPAARTAGVAHHVVLSIVGTDRLQDSAYFRAKQAQEAAVAASGLPYTIVRATQFFEFVAAIVRMAGGGDPLSLPAQAMQPLAAADAAAALSDIAAAPPARGIREIAGPEAAPIADFAARWLRAEGDPRRIVADPEGTYVGARLDTRSLLPGTHARILPSRFDDWLEARRA